MRPNIGKPSAIKTYYSRSINNKISLNVLKKFGKLIQQFTRQINKGGDKY